MFYLIQFLFYLSFILYKLYSLLDRSCIFSSQGSKLKKYLTHNLESITCNLESTNKKISFKDLIQKFQSPRLNKQLFYTLLVSIAIIAIKIAFSYNFILSNSLIIYIFNKKIDISYILYPYYSHFKLLYYILFSIFILIITKKYIISIFIPKQIEIDEPINGLYIGKYKEKNIYIEKQGLYQNILITGSIGSGKTSSAITNLLDGLVKDNVSGLIIDIKGNFIETVEKICKKYNKNSKLIKITLDNEIKYNPLNKSNTSYEIASNLKKILTLISSKNISDSFWLDKAESYIRDLITIMKAYIDNINFYELHSLVTNKDYLEEKINVVKDNLFKNKYSEPEMFNIRSAILNIQNEYFKLDDRTNSIIKAEITRITGIFVSDYNLYNKFCSACQSLNFSDDNIVVLSIGIGKNSELTKLIATYLKLDFQKQVLSRKTFNPIFFICDEFEKIVNIEDANFFSLSREFKCINIISIQSYSSINSILANENSTKVIIQNLVNKIWFRNDDLYTVNEIIKQIGKDYKEFKTSSYSENGQNSRYSLLSNKFKSYKVGLSQTYSISQKLDYLYNENYFTKELKSFEAVMMLSDGYNINFFDKVYLKRWEEEKNEQKFNF